MINLLQLIKAFWRGFVGGPDFNRCITHRFQLEDKQLSITIPDSNVVAAPSTLNTYFPHNSSVWFKQNTRESYDQHLYVHMITENWMYMPVIAVLPSCEYGMFSCQLRIKQTDKINVLDKEALACFVIQEYDDYHNGSNGINTKIRKDTAAQSIKRANPWSPEALENQIKLIINNRGKPPIPKGILKTFNQTDWVFYQEVRNNRLSRSDFCCLPLSKTSFLEIEFRHRVDRSDKHKKWAKHALESQERIMASIYLDELPDATLIEDSDK